MSRVVIGVFVAVLLLGSESSLSDERVFVKAGDNQKLIEAFELANRLGDGIIDKVYIFIEVGPNGETGFDFTQGYKGTNNALPVLTGQVIIKKGVYNDSGASIGFTGTGQWDFRLIKVEGRGSVRLEDCSIRNFGVTGESGGAVLISGEASMVSQRSNFRNNFSDMNGGAIALTGSRFNYFFSSEFENNRSSGRGGAITIEGQSGVVIDGSHGGPGTISLFDNNQAGIFGCDLNIQTSGSTTVKDTVFDGVNCQNVLIENPAGKINLSGNTITHNGSAVDSTAVLHLLGNVLQGPEPLNQVNSLSPKPKPQATCNDFGIGTFISDGHNISSDDGCSLNQLSDQPNTDPMLSLNQDGLPVVDEGSPVIDAGGTEVYVVNEEDLASLPCGYVDIQGVARPQDGNGDGEFECDSGASEFPGGGSVQAGHSGAFYNTLRNGEGNYVEILSDSTAVVYTFTYRPDGSGPAWFIGVGDIRDNGIVIDEVLRPIGTSFGAGFDPDAIDYSSAGSMSMVFPDCDAGGSGGVVAYSGSHEAGYEGVLSRTQRITSITGCNTVPTPNAGLSGSFYDPARNGEGVIVEWLENGDVIAIFFTFDQNGDQFWTFGVGTPTGKSVTIDAIYPAGSTVWGRGFNADDVDLQSWGTFELTWTACDTLTFDYNSTVSGYGSGSLDYTRVSSLQGTTCPTF